MKDENHMWKLLPYLKNYKKESIVGPLFKLLEACFELVVPIIMARIIDVGIQNRDMGYVLRMGGVLILLGILGLACSLTAQYYAAKAGVGFGTELRHDMFQHINRLSYSEIDKAGNATLVIRMTSDINQVQAGVNLVLRLFSRSPFIVIGATLMAFTIHAKAALIFVIAVPVLAFVIYGIMMLTIPLYRKVQKGLDYILLAARENLAGIRVVRAFGTQQREKEAFEEQSGQLMKQQLYVGKLSALLNPLTYVLVHVGIIAVVWFGGTQVNVGAMSQGEVIALVSYMSQILLALVALANLIITCTKSLACAGRLNEVFALKSSISEGSKEVVENEGPTVAMQKVSFVYPGGKEKALSDITFEAYKGETIGIIGGTGAGKSSLINLIPRFYDAVHGEVRFFGTDVREWKSSNLREKIGVVSQKAVLFHGTIRENMQMSKKEAADEEIYRALWIAQAKELVDGKPEGLNTIISEGGKNLSGGQKQRLTIARALVRNPRVLILDDSASALDYATDAKLRKALRDNCKEMTVFIVSQRAAAILHADKILVLDDGHMVGMAKHEELMDTCEVYREILQSQLSKEEVSLHA